MYFSKTHILPNDNPFSLDEPFSPPQTGAKSSEQSLLQDFVDGVTPGAAKIALISSNAKKNKV